MRQLWYDAAAVEISEMEMRLTPIDELASIILKHWDECPDDEKQIIMDLRTENERLRHEVASMGHLLGDCE